ncbi:MAG: flagellar basal body rod protein FlgB [Clostridia bacterium]|nr:flagellar basal body rod protein FlgB [Clostridia bacterium]
MLGGILNRTRGMEKALDAAWLRNEAISQNISNVDTPGYKRKTVAFEEYLSDAMGESTIKGIRTDKRHIPIGGNSIDKISINITEDNGSSSMRIDGNNVDIDSEMASLAKNNIKYNALIQNINGSFKKLRSVISEGRR